MALVVEKRYVEVLLPLKLDKTLTYRLPDGVKVAGEPDTDDPGSGGIIVGSWVQVPLRGHPALGVVFQILDSAPKGVNLSSMETVTVLPDKPAASAEELAFWHDVADYYLCTPGEVFKAAYNSGLQRLMLQPDKPKKNGSGATRNQPRPNLENPWNNVISSQDPSKEHFRKSARVSPPKSQYYCTVPPAAGRRKSICTWPPNNCPKVTMSSISSLKSPFPNNYSSASKPFSESNCGFFTPALPCPSATT